MTTTIALIFGGAFVAGCFFLAMGLESLGEAIGKSIRGKEE